MIDTFFPEHFIQKHIVGVLMQHKYARFRDMRLPGWETNLYSYHLKLLQKHGFVVKTDSGYTLAKAGLLYVDRVSAKTLNIRTQPKIISMLVIHDSAGNVLLYKRGRQPYADVWTLPYGKLHIDDASVLAAALREAQEKLGSTDMDLVHAGDCYIRVQDEVEIVISTLAHIFRGQSDAIRPAENILWTSPETLPDLPLAPAVREIVSRTARQDSYFFEEYLVDW
jgi:ADP-ribose pyrophosphatase YjhB (NUDIX family)